MKNIIYYIFYRLYCFSKKTKAVYPCYTAAAFLCLGVFLPLLTVALCVNKEVVAKMLAGKLFPYTIWYYATVFLTFFSVLSFFERKKRYLKIAQSYKKSKNKNKLLVDILLMIYYIGIVLSFGFVVLK